jgi:hypothetical protein
MQSSAKAPAHMCIYAAGKKGGRSRSATKVCICGVEKGGVTWIDSEFCRRHTCVNDLKNPLTEYPSGRGRLPYPLKRFDFHPLTERKMTSQAGLMKAFDELPNGGPCRVLNNAENELLWYEKMLSLGRVKNWSLVGRQPCALRKGKYMESARPFKCFARQCPSLCSRPVLIPCLNPIAKNEPLDTCFRNIRSLINRRMIL